MKLDMFENTRNQFSALCSSFSHFRVGLIVVFHLENHLFRLCVFFCCLEFYIYNAAYGIWLPYPFGSTFFFLLVVFECALLVCVSVCLFAFE